MSSARMRTMLGFAGAAEAWSRQEHPRKQEPSKERHLMRLLKRRRAMASRASSEFRIECLELGQERDHALAQPMFHPTRTTPPGFAKLPIALLHDQGLMGRVEERGVSPRSILARLAGQAQIPIAGERFAVDVQRDERALRGQVRPRWGQA